MDGSRSDSYSCKKVYFWIYWRLVDNCLHGTHGTKWRSDELVDLGGHAIRCPRPIHLPPNVLSRRNSYGNSIRRWNRNILKLHTASILCKNIGQQFQKELFKKDGIPVGIYSRWRSRWNWEVAYNAIYPFGILLSYVILICTGVFYLIPNFVRRILKHPVY